MKFLITDWIKNGDISPLRWGESFHEIARVFKNSSTEIELLKQRQYPFIVLDFVEFYFNDDIHFFDLTEVIIKPVSLYKGMKNRYFDPGWLTNHVTFETTSKKLTEMKIDWHIERGPNFGTPNIRTSKGWLFAFDSIRTSDNEAGLMKIYLQNERT